MDPPQRLKMTPQRRQILSVLRSRHWHPTADEVYAEVRREIPRISLGTVYRNLELLARAGLIQKLATAGPQKRYDGNPTRHFHLRCRRCGRLEDAPVQEGFDPLDFLTDPAGYTVEGFVLEYQGLCASCRRASPEDPPSRPPSV
ncbi:Fur family transcriptional regulator, ferric uptake regulator [Desulfacinum hydrothermale DSM 13146]|uniref:Fur family transcriptional regulator, ferric uptake regulator n=1 Tax=Desulfacinum hydrothermale DSM 13146 TaxID=1121390 RepID=A0A1W1XGH5_9BACT|nr:transcriptional repressor [Desulfacinum hydrothermale]SMC23106.1 Fur family transcriptional regulator, ferric uptake regulator [Desulfacinum hydrothermale DSM 13146]